MDKTTINSAEFSRLPITTGQRTEDCFFFQFLSSSSGLTIGKQSVNIDSIMKLSAL
mgnify:CR=1 FL=1